MREESLNECRKHYLAWCVDNGKLDVTIGSKKSSAAWQAWKAAWELQDALVKGCLA